MAFPGNARVTDIISPKNHMHHTTSCLLQHLLKMSYSSTNASGGRQCHSPTAHSVTTDPEWLTRCWCIISLHRCTIL